MKNILLALILLSMCVPIASGKDWNKEFDKILSKKEDIAKKDSLAFILHNALNIEYFEYYLDSLYVVYNNPEKQEGKEHESLNDSVSDNTKIPAYISLNDKQMLISGFLIQCCGMPSFSDYSINYYTDRFPPKLYLRDLPTWHNWLKINKKYISPELIKFYCNLLGTQIIWKTRYYNWHERVMSSEEKKNKSNSFYKKWSDVFWPCWDKSIKGYKEYSFLWGIQASLINVFYWHYSGNPLTELPSEEYFLYYVNIKKLPYTKFNRLNGTMDCVGY